MNARDRITRVVHPYIGEGPAWDETAHECADAVLAVLPNLLTDSEVVAAAASELKRWEVEAVAGINYEAIPSVTRQVLAAAAKALTGDVW